MKRNGRMSEEEMAKMVFERLSLDVRDCGTSSIPIKKEFPPTVSSQLR